MQTVVRRIREGGAPEATREIQSSLESEGESKSTGQKEITLENMTLHINESEVRSVLTMAIALEAVEDSLRKQARDEVVVQPRRRFELPKVFFITWPPPIIPPASSPKSSTPTSPEKFDFSCCFTKLPLATSWL